MQDHDFQHTRAAGDVGQHHGYHRHQVGGQELEEGNVRIRGKQDVQAGPRRDEVGPGHHSLSDGDLEGREREFLAEDVDRLMDEFADDQIADGDEEQDGAEGADIQRHMHTQFRRDLRGRDHENRPDEPERADPEGDGEHQHQPDDVHRGKAPA